MYIKCTLLNVFRFIGQPKIKQDQFLQESQQFEAGQYYQMQDMNFKLKIAQFFLKEISRKKDFRLIRPFLSILKAFLKKKTVFLFESPLKLKSI